MNVLYILYTEASELSKHGNRLHIFTTSHDIHNARQPSDTQYDFFFLSVGCKMD